MPDTSRGNRTREGDHHTGPISKRLPGRSRSGHGRSNRWWVTGDDSPVLLV